MRAPRALGVLQGFDDEDRRALAEHKAVSVDIPRPGGALGFVIAAAHGLHLRKAGDRQRVDDALGPSHDSNIGPAEPQHVQAERDRLIARRAGRHGRVRPGSGSEPQADIGRGGVGHQHGDAQRADPTSAFLFLDVPVGKQSDHPADAGGDGDAKPLTVDWVVLPEPVPGVLPGLQCGDNR